MLTSRSFFFYIYLAYFDILIAPLHWRASGGSGKKYSAVGRLRLPYSTPDRLCAGQVKGNGKSAGILFFLTGSDRASRILHGQLEGKGMTSGGRFCAGVFISHSDAVCHRVHSEQWRVMKKRILVVVEGAGGEMFVWESNESKDVTAQNTKEMISCSAGSTGNDYQKREVR